MAPTVSFRLSEELAEEIDKDRAEQGTKTGEIPDRSDWIRDALRQKLGGENGNGDGTPQERGAA